MSIRDWLSRLFDKGQEDALSPNDPKPQPAPVDSLASAPPEPARSAQPGFAASSELARIGQSGGPDEAQALALLEQAAGTEREHEALAAVASAIATAPVPESIASRCAVLLAARGDRDGALRMLERTTRPQDLMLRADLLSERGQTALALTIVERVLAQDIDYPGARERHQRWSASSRAAVAARARDDVTVAVPTIQRSPFRILREAARGGSGVIYEAHDDVIGRAVAYKVYHQSAEWRAQLEREARLAIRLAGPGIVRIYDASFEDGWLAVEWIALGSVRDLLATGRVQELGPVRSWAGALARAIARVHSANLVHADLKPANVLMRSAVEPVLCDFGIAAPVGSKTLGGSAGYLSPERLNGAILSPRDDVFAFGRVLQDALARMPDPQMNRVALQCLGPERPANGLELVTLLTTIHKS